MSAARRPESQEQILQAAAGSLTEAGIPPGDQDGWLDRDTDPPAELAALSDPELDELLAAAPPPAATSTIRSRTTSTAALASATWPRSAAFATGSSKPAAGPSPKPAPAS